jgi:hypothetical protein
MAQRMQLRLTLEVDPRSDPISGRMRAEDGESRAFTGWLGLAEVLGSVLGRGDGSPSATVSPDDRDTRP